MDIAFEPIQVRTKKGSDQVRFVVWSMRFICEGYDNTSVGETLLPDPIDDNYLPIEEVDNETLKKWVIAAEGGDEFLNQLLDFHSSRAEFIQEVESLDVYLDNTKEYGA